MGRIFVWGREGFLDIIFPMEGTQQNSKTQGIDTVY